MKRAKPTKDSRKAIFVRVSLDAFHKIKQEAEREKRTIGNHVAVVLERLYDTSKG